MEDLIKGELDWHNKVNENFHEVDSQMADIAINVKTYGAVMDGSSDSSDVIKNCLNIHSHLFIPNGTVLVSNVDFGNKNVIIEGNGDDSIIIIDNILDNSHGVYSNNCGKVIFKNLKLIIKDGGSLGTGNQGAPLAFRYGNGVVFDNVNFDTSNLPDDATCSIHIRKLKYFIFKNCRGNYKNYFILGMGINNDNGNTQINKVIVDNCHFTADKNSLSFFEIDNEPDDYPTDGIINDMYAYINNNCIIKDLQDDNSPHAGQCFGIGYSRDVIYAHNKIINYEVSIDMDNPDSCFITKNILINKGILTTNSIGIRVGTDDNGVYASHKRNTIVNIIDNIISGFNYIISSDTGTLLKILNNTISNFNIALNLYDQKNTEIIGNQYTFNNGSSLLKADNINNIDISKNNFYLNNDTSIINYLLWIDATHSANFIYINENILFADLDHIIKAFINLGTNSNDILIKDNININILNTSKTIEEIANKISVGVGGMEFNINGNKYKVNGTWSSPVALTSSNIVAA